MLLTESSEKKEQKRKGRKGIISQLYSPSIVSVTSDEGVEGVSFSGNSESW